MVDKTALVIIDIQKGLFIIEDFPLYKEDVLIKNIQLLIKKARKRRKCRPFLTVRSAVSNDYDVILIQDAHSTINSEILKAPQIIAHHNDILRSFSDLQKTEEIKF